MDIGGVAVTTVRKGWTWIAWQEIRKDWSSDGLVNIVASSRSWLRGRTQTSANLSECRKSVSEEVKVYRCTVWSCQRQWYASRPNQRLVTEYVIVLNQEKHNVVRGTHRKHGTHDRVCEDAKKLPEDCETVCSEENCQKS